jgi:hypothetical protein
VEHVTNQRKSNRLGLAFGLGASGSFLFGRLALILFCFWKRHRSHTEEELALDNLIKLSNIMLDSNFNAKFEDF